MSDDIKAISGVRGPIRERVDGTLAVTVFIEPRHVSDFHRLFPKIDAPIALAPLSKDFDKPQPPDDRRAQHRAPDRSISRWVAMRCAEPHFWQFLTETYGRAHGVTNNEETAAEVVRKVCVVQSRAEFDSDDDAQSRFDLHIRRPFNAWIRQEERS